MEKRYQVFVSSTYTDLQEARQEVMHALLGLDCIPSGMELFPAANDDQWSTIKRAIEDCDYYILILAGRYGSIHESGLSYTEMEYHHALQVNKPTLAFLHKSPGDLPQQHCETTDEGREKLNRFRNNVQRRLCKHWTTPQELGTVVTISLLKLIKHHPAPGWIRGTHAMTEDTAREMLRMKGVIEELEAELRSRLTTAPVGSEDLAQGSDALELKFTFSAYNTTTGSSSRYKTTLTTTWDTVVSTVCPLMINEANEDSMKTALNTLIRDEKIASISRGIQFRSHQIEDLEIHPDSFHTIKIQLRALGLIQMSDKSRSIKDTSTYWSLTPLGDATVTRLRAIKRSPQPESRANSETFTIIPPAEDQVTTKSSASATSTAPHEPPRNSPDG